MSGETIKDLLGIDPNRVWEAVKKADAERAERMLDEAAALAVMFDAYRRLQELGWKSITYCPKDGTRFLAIEAGSTGQHLCYYDGTWPDGSWWIEDGETWPSYPILWKPVASHPCGEDV